MKFRENPWKAWDWCAYTLPATKKENLDSCVVKLRKFSCKTFYIKSYVTLFCRTVYSMLSKVVWVNIFSFETPPRPNGVCTFDIFYISKDSFIPQTYIKGKLIDKKTYIWHISRSANFHFGIKYRFGTKYWSN